MIPQLRDYQKRAIEDAYAWLNTNRGNLCIVAPTGSGKSWIVAGLCEDLLNGHEGRRIIVLSHVKELLVQDAEKIVAAWPEAPLGVYSAGLGRKDMNAITVAGIQSIWKKAGEAGHVGLVIVDEAHLINNQDAGMYRTFIEGLRETNPHLRVIGLTATPYRLGQGMVTEGEDSLFDELIESVSIEELVARGYLARLRSKFTDVRLDVSGVARRGGEFVESELQARVDTEDSNAEIVAETIRRAEGRQSWLFFCTGVEHARHMRDELRRQGVTAEAVTGDMPKEQRAWVLENFKAGRIKALTNMNVLTTGFDHPDIDLIVMARPTLSPGLYLQMAGRGMRVKSGPYADCLVLDFAGNIARHGPVTSVTPPGAKGKGEPGMAPVKECPKCQEAVPAGVKVCPCCGYVFPEQEKERPELNETEDIMGGPVRMEVRGWFWSVRKSKKNGTPMLRVDFFGQELMADVVSLYLCLMHGGYAEEKAKKILHAMTGQRVGELGEDDLRDIAETMNASDACPSWVEYRRRGHFPEIARWGWEEHQDEAAG